MTGPSVLIVDDEPDLCEVVRYNLSKAGFSTFVAATGEAAVALANEKVPNAIVLDLLLPGLDGFEVCAILKRSPATRTIPILILSARGEEADVVRGLDLGADDYLTKPFSPKVLIARVRSVLRRAAAPAKTEDLVTAEGIVLDPVRFRVTVDGGEVPLTATEFKLLHLLMQHPGRVFTRDKIVDKVHGEDYPATDRSVDVQVVGLRRKLQPYSHLVETVRGVGYRFTEFPGSARPDE